MLADRVGVRALLLARAATLPTGIYLGFSSADVARTVTLANSIWAVLWVLVTNGFVWRRGLSLRAGVVLVVVDTQIALTGVIATGGVDSRMTELLGVLPLAIAFALRPHVVLSATTFAMATLVAAAGGDLEGTVPIVVVVAWSGLAGAILARERGLVLDRIRREAAVRGSLLRAHGLAAARERLRVADTLHEGALADVRRLRADTGLGAPAHELAAACRATAGTIRALVSELHAMSARPIVLRSALAQLAARRAAGSGREITVEVVDEVQGERDDLVLVAVRDLLDALPPGHPATRVRIGVSPRTAGGVQIALDAASDDPDASVAIDPEELTLALLRERLAWIPGAALQVAGRSARVVVPGAPDPAERERRMEDQLVGVGVPSAAGLVAIVAIAAIAGPPSAAFWGLAAAVGVTTALLLAATARSTLDTGRLRAVASYDVAAVLVLLAAAGPAQDDLRRLVIGLVPVFAFVFGPRLVAALAIALGAGTLVLCGGGTPFVVAFAWSLVVALLLADSGRRSTELAADAAARGRAALQQVMTAEEDARRAVARRLHDDALQLLFAASLDLDDAASGTEADAARERAMAALVDAERVIAGSSLATGGDAVPPGGLGHALRELGARTARSGALAVTVDVPSALPAGPHEALMYGVARELLTNVVRHARAARVTVTLIAPPGGPLVLRVSDDGCGIGDERLAQAASEGHVGLAAAHDRLVRAGGHLAVADSGEDATGTTVVAVVPAQAAGTRAPTLGR